MTQSTEIQHWTARAGNLRIGSGNPIVIQTMCDTRTSDVDATLAQCLRLHHAGAQLIRITVPGPTDVECLKAIKEGLRARGVETPLVADIHFSSRTAILAARVAEKVRINPGNFHRDHTEARMQFAKLLEVCKEEARDPDQGKPRLLGRLHHRAVREHARSDGQGGDGMA